ncbi:MAG: hypothetical protein HY681_10415 [Chloroflexi bacterium]|nr:hypothetical protein [Chloroflexota bacterium]
MALNKGAIQSLLREAGLKPTPEEVETTTQLHEALAKQLSKASTEGLSHVEPDYIQPMRRQQRRR